MRSRLRPDDVLRRDDGVQWAALPGERLLVRGTGGLSVIDGVTRQDVEAVLAEVDGRRRAEEIVDALAPRYSTRRAVRLLRRLDGELLRRVAPALTGRVLVVADGAAGARITQFLDERGIRAEPEKDPAAAAVRLDDIDLVLIALEETFYEKLFELQAACLAAGATSLFVTFDADGARVGPLTVAGETACFACAQLTSFGPLRGEDAGLPEAIGQVRTLAWDGAPAALEAAAEEVRRLLADDREPELLARAARFMAAGSTTYPVVPDIACPLGCQGASSHRGSRSALTALELAEAEERRPPLAAPADDGELVRTIGILGGGTAGYLAALALRRKLPHLRVTLVESSAVPIIGVGEATTPLMPQFLHADLGIDVHELFREVRPTLKLGIRFLWGPPEDGDFNYPFGAVRPLEALCYDGHLRCCSLRSMMMSEDRIPLLERDDRGVLSRLDTEVAYHLDNARFVDFLRRQALEAGVEHVDATVADVETSAAGDAVRALVTSDGRRLDYDFYVDCSGFRSLLIERALDSPFVSFSRSLFTDRAWVATVALDRSKPIPPYTLAETLPSGWCWSTPQLGEDHLGYVFCSAFEDDDAALTEMRARHPGMDEPRLVKFRAGRHEHFLKGNVAALGNAYAFVEPLESTALHMLIRQIGLLLQAFPLRRGHRGPEALLNRKVNRSWDYLSWFLALHYKFNRKLETPFWRACRDEVDVSLHGELLEAFAERGPLSYERTARRTFDYPDPLWGAEGVDVVLLGQRVASRLPRPRLGREEWERRLALCRQTVDRALRQGRSLELFREEPRLLERLAAAYRAAGPAFLV